MYLFKIKMSRFRMFESDYDDDDYLPYYSDDEECEGGTKDKVATTIPESKK